MPYNIYDINNREVSSQELQNRGVWYEHGQKKEEAFVSLYGIQLGVTINPAKAADPTLPDLILADGGLADLKCQNTPHFTAGRYDAVPQTSVTFNLKDALSYHLKYPEITIFFWVDWIAVRMEMGDQEYVVQPMQGVWKTSMRQLEEFRRTSPIHWYNKRQRVAEDNPTIQQTLVEFDHRLKEGEYIYSIRSDVNAACSYVLDLGEMDRVV